MTAVFVGFLAGQLLAACGSAEPAEGVPDEVARRIGPLMLESLAQEPLTDDLHAVLVRALEEIEPPASVQSIAAGRSWQTEPAEPDGTHASFSVVVRPHQGEPYCAVVGVARHGETEGARAHGDPDKGCAEAEPLGPSSDLLNGWHRPAG